MCARLKMELYFFPHADTLKAMTHVADYINEVQRLCETYGTVLESFLKDQLSSEVRLDSITLQSNDTDLVYPA